MCINHAPHVCTMGGRWGQSEPSPDTLDTVDLPSVHAAKAAKGPFIPFATARKVKRLLESSDEYEALVDSWGVAAYRRGVGEEDYRDYALILVVYGWMLAQKVQAERMKLVLGGLALSEKASRKWEQEQELRKVRDGY